MFAGLAFPFDAASANASGRDDLRLRRAAIGFLVAAGAMSGTILAGWSLNIDALKTVVPGPVSMKPHASVAIVALTLALLVQVRWAKHALAARVLVATLVALVVGFAVLSLSQDLTGRNLGIDQLLFKDLDPATRGAPGRLSAPTSYVLILIGLAVALLTTAKTTRWRLPAVLGLSSAAAIVAITAIGGRLANNLLGSSFWNVTPIAIDTALTLLVLAIATFLFARSEDESKWLVDGITGSGFVIGILSLLLTAGSTYYLARQLQSQVDRMVSAEEVIKAIEVVARDLANTTATLRAYVIVGDERLADRRARELEQLNAAVLQLRLHVSNQPDQLEHLDQLQAALATRTVAGNRLIEVRRTRGFAAAEQIVATGIGAALTDSVGSALDVLRTVNYARLEDGRLQSAESARRNFLMMPLSVAISITMLMLGLYTLNRTQHERQDARATLDEHETVFRAIFEASTDGILVIGANGDIVRFNQSAASMFGLEDKAASTLSASALFPALNSELSAGLRDAVAAGVAPGTVGRAIDLEALGKNGQAFRAEISLSAFQTPKGHFTAAVVRDVSARHEAQRKLKRLSNFYDALSRTNQAVVKMRDEASLFQEICRICVEHGHATLAFIAILDGGRIVPRESAGTDAEAFLASIRIDLDPAQPHGQGTVATAIREGKPYVCNDFMADPRTVPWRVQASTIGTQSTAAFPILRDGVAIGALSLHMRERNFFDVELVNLLTEMTSDVTLALHNLDRERARTSAEAALDASEVRIRSVFEQANDGILVLSNDHRILDCNRAAAAMLGYSREDLLLLRLPQVLAPRDQARVEATVAAVFAGSSELQEWECIRKDGSALVGDVSLRALDTGSYLAIVRDLTERRRAERNLEHMATHDALTDLPNQNLMRDRIARAMSHARRSGRLVAVMYVDIDRFKVVNDAYGHIVGDALLMAAANRLCQLVRDEDTVARQTGDEFVILLPDLRKSSDAYIVAQKLIDAFAEPFDLHLNSIPVGISVGVSVFPQDSEDVATLIGNAEVAMYRAKEQGRATYQFFTQEMSNHTREQVMLETGLRAALAQGELHLAYQPKVDLKTGRILGSEALLRWTRPGLGAVSPAQFIPVAEESGLIVPIGDWVLRTACKQAKAWCDAGLQTGVVSVNLSVRQFLRVNVVDWVLAVLAETGLAPQWLELELTESLIARDTEKVIETVNRLRAAGVTISIDDFGTGYSSLSYLKRFKVNTLKIDQSFIRNMHKDPEDEAIPVAVISLAHALGLKVIAEGVETAEHCALLHSHSCDQIQGYFFSRPVTASEYAAMVSGNRRVAMDDMPRIVEAE